MKKHLAAYSFTGKAKARHRDRCRHNPEVAPCNGRGSVVPFGGHVYVRLPLTDGSTAAYRFTPASSWKCRPASKAEVEHLPTLSTVMGVEIDDFYKFTGTKPIAAPSAYAVKVRDDLLNAAAAIDQRLLKNFMDAWAALYDLLPSTSGDGAHLSGAGARPPQNGGASDHPDHRVAA
jgi:hypothetical protein